MAAECSELLLMTAPSCSLGAGAQQVGAGRHCSSGGRNRADADDHVSVATFLRRRKAAIFRLAVASMAAP